ncbi:MAG: PrsW family intramembrane metalloprotease [Clostridia bacterium]|nr:PrsW family intramembrane metalloprotease [Clostridia bacterium]
MFFYEFLIAAAVIPAVVLLVYVYKKDRTEKEPIGLLLLLLALGGLSTLAAAGLEVVASGVLDGFFVDSIYYNADGEAVFSGGGKYLYYFIENFFCVALIEEACKWLILWFVTHKSRYFACLFDGMVYAVFVSLGFALVENIQYVVTYGFSVAVIRAFTAVPGHMFDGVFMGYFYSFWHSYKVTNTIESRFCQTYSVPLRGNRLPEGRALALSFVLPVVMHGVYDFTASIEEWWAGVFFVAFIVFLYVYCFRKVRELSRRDNHDINITAYWLYRKYPEYTGYLYDFLVQRW